MQSFTRTHLRALATVAAAGVVLAGCANNPAADVTTAPDDGATEHSVTGTPVDAPDDASTDVTVTLTEFAVEMSRASFEAGVEYTFTIVNEGDAAHELLALGDDGAGMGGMGGMDHGSDHGDGHDSAEMDAMHDDAFLVVTENELPAGATVTRAATFDEVGALEFACHLPGHYEAGMLTAGTVTEG